jgi:hypothetical protein
MIGQDPMRIPWVRIAVFAAFAWQSLKLPEVPLVLGQVPSGTAVSAKVTRRRAGTSQGIGRHEPNEVKTQSFFSI